MQFDACIFFRWVGEKPPTRDIRRVKILQLPIYFRPFIGINTPLISAMGPQPKPYNFRGVYVFFTWFLGGQNLDFSWFRGGSWWLYLGPIYLGFF